MIERVFALGFSAACWLVACAGAEPTRSSVGAPAQPVASPPVLPAGHGSAESDIVIGETDIRDRSGAVIAGLPVDRTHGAPAALKRSGENDLFIVPLASALIALKKQGHPEPLVIEVAPSTPYRLLVEVTYTAGASEWASCDIRLGGSRKNHIVSRPPTARTAPASDDKAFHLTVIVIADGVSIKTRGGNVAPGCLDVGAGLAIPLGSDGRPDRPALATCLKRVKDLFRGEHEATMLANPAVTFDVLEPVAESVRGENGELFPDIMWGIAR